MRNSEASRKVPKLWIGQRNTPPRTGRETRMLILLYEPSYCTVTTPGLGELKSCVKLSSLSIPPHHSLIGYGVMECLFYSPPREYHVLIDIGICFVWQNWAEEAKFGFEQSKLSRQCDHRWVIAQSSSSAAAAALKWEPYPHLYMFRAIFGLSVSQLLSLMALSSIPGMRYHLSTTFLYLLYWLCTRAPCELPFVVYSINTFILPGSPHIQLCTCIAAVYRFPVISLFADM